LEISCRHAGNHGYIAGSRRIQAVRRSHSRRADGPVGVLADSAGDVLPQRPNGVLVCPVVLLGP
jgi:hypothetical protein